MIAYGANKLMACCASKKGNSEKHIMMVNKTVHQFS